MPVEVSLVRVLLQGRRFVAAYAQDLRQFIEAEEKIREAEERAKLLTDALPTACFLFDSNRRAIDCNQAAIILFAKKHGSTLAQTYPGQPGFARCKIDCRECRYRRREVCFVRKFVVDRYWRIIPGNDREQADRTLAAWFGRTLSEGVQRFEFSAVTLYGETVPCEVTIVPVRYRGSHAFAVYMRDLLEEKRRKTAEEESRAKTRFLARMSHEIRTPMNAVLGIAEIQLRKAGHPPETEEAFMRIYSSSSLLLSILNDILDISKVEAGRMEIIPVKYDIASLIIDTVQLNLMHIGSKKIGFVLDVDERLPASLVGDELRIKQVLNNLLSNAFKYTHEGTVSLSFTLGEPPENGDDNNVTIVIKVGDTGQGMTQEQIDNVFNMEFTRFNIHSNRGIEGTGLGMSIARSFIDMMHGTVEVESAPGEGSTFTVRLPQKENGYGILGSEAARNLSRLEVRREYQSSPDKFSVEPMPYGRVLVVDDVDINLYVAEGILLSYGITVETAESGQEAIAKVKAGEVYDIIFMDHMMPEMDGIETTRILREMGYRHPIVALTANAFSDARAMFLRQGFSGFVSKPIDVAQLDEYLVKFVRDKHMGGQGTG